ncbi:MAG: isoprenylcysteine carboxylmethyltransferase family protein [Chloroflexi bacterium]|nr:isoprenylcysteine carboxylmethyltransferase family protein [Chloroflexota bacterium]
MKLVDKIVEVSNKPPSSKRRLAAIIPPILVFFFFFPSLLFLIPNLVLDRRLNLPTLPGTPIRVAVGSILIALGVLFLLWTIKAQREIGKGTPMPLMATQKLVVQKPYSYCRNPLAFGLINFYLGISILIGSISSMIMVLLFSTIILSYIKLIEEKELERRYGDEYIEYKKRTPFIIPGLRREH